MKEAVSRINEQTIEAVLWQGQRVARFPLEVLNGITVELPEL
jgi:hypothetical protein